MDDENAKKIHGKVAAQAVYDHIRRTSVFGALAAVFGEYCGENAPDTGVLR